MKTIYVDTSVFGGQFDREFELWTKLFFNTIKQSEIKLIFSNVAQEELSNSPQYVKDFVNSLPEKNLEKVELSEEAVQLAEQYLIEGVVGQSSRTDCYHIALATVLKVDILVSWNFKHIVNVKKINGYNAVNLKKGYRTLEIRTPREIIEYENND